MEKKVTMTFTEEELDDLSHLVEMAIDEGSTHEDFIALQERLKEENEKLQDDSEDEDEVKTAVYFTKEELKDLKRVLDNGIEEGYNHPDYLALKDKLTEELNNFPMNPVTKAYSYNDVVTHTKGDFKIWFDELHRNENKKDDISLDSKIGKKCSVWCTKYDDDHGWVTKEIDKKKVIFKGVYNNNYVLEFSHPLSYPIQADSKIEHRVLYIPMGDAMLSFNKEDL